MSEPSGKAYIVVCGPTASGKSTLALQIAENFNGEIICCDSVQVYEGFHIGAASPSPEDKGKVPHHLYNFLSADQAFDAASYRKAAREKIAEVIARGKMPIVCGGTGLYLRALLGVNWDDDLPSDPELREKLKHLSKDELFSELQELNPIRANEIHPNDKFRLERAVEIARLQKGQVSSLKNKPQIDQNAFIIKLIPERSLLHKNIEKRVGLMLQNGLIEEVKKHLEGVAKPEECKALSSIGYKQVVDFLHGNIEEKDLSDKVLFATRQYAKRQCTWFKQVEADVFIELPEFSEELSLQLQSQFKF